MSAADPRRVPFDGVRIRFDSDKAFDELVEALLSDVGAEPVAIEAIAAADDDWESYEARIRPHVGPAGFMLFGMFDHGAWLSKAGIDRRVLRVIIGNPLIAITMLRHDVTAGLFAPVELLIVDAGAASSLTYVQPSSLMVVEANPPLLAAARELDAKLEALARSIV